MFNVYEIDYRGHRTRIASFMDEAKATAYRDEQHRLEQYKDFRLSKFEVKKED